MPHNRPDHPSLNSKPGCIKVVDTFRTTPGGQPWYSPLAILTALTLRAVFCLALRQTEGLIGSVIGLLGLGLAVPDHTTLCRRAETLEVPRPRSGPGAEPMHLLVDSTGLKLLGAGEWLHEKHGTTLRRPWRKLHLGMDAGTEQIVASLLTTKGVDDGSQVGVLLDQLEGPLASFTGDGAYDQDGVTASVAARHPEAAIIVPPRSNAVPSETAETAPTLLFQPLCGRNLEQLRPHSGTAISSISPSTAAWAGRQRQATPNAHAPRRRWRASSR